MKDKLINLLNFLYQERAEQVYTEIDNRTNGLLSKQNPPTDKETKKTKLTADDIILISYGDSVVDEGTMPLQTLNYFLNNYTDGAFSALHILPCYPYTSDDGFSVVDYRHIDSNLGDWHDVTTISNSHDLMLDAVVNHISIQSHWFKQYLKGDPAFENFFIEADPKGDYSKVTRPRALPLFTEFETSRGNKKIWTTFSEDQVDLNFSNPAVLVEVIDVLKFYANHGAKFIRLDAIGFIWKKLGSTCMHLPETHALIQVMRQVLEATHPETLLITETNVPHRENTSYFGNGEKEAHMVYQFPLPPLVIFSMLMGDASQLNSWVTTLEEPPDGCYFFNFLASHDGIGIRPVEEILSAEEIDFMVRMVLERKGCVSYRYNSDGSKSPYELNITFRDAICPSDADPSNKAKIMVAAHAILLSLQGVPAIYFQSFIGDGNDYQGLAESGMNRKINRKKHNLEILEQTLADETSLNHMIWRQLTKLIQLRKSCPFFAPDVKQRIEKQHQSLFVLERSNELGKLTAIINVSDSVISINEDVDGFDLLSGQHVKKRNFEPYEVLWLENKDDPSN